MGDSNGHNSSLPRGNLYTLKYSNNRTLICCYYNNQHSPAIIHHLNELKLPTAFHFVHLNEIFLKTRFVFHWASVGTLRLQCARTCGCLKVLETSRTYVYKINQTKWQHSNPNRYYGAFIVIDAISKKVLYKLLFCLLKHICRKIMSSIDHNQSQRLLACIIQKYLEIHELENSWICCSSNTVPL